MPEIKERKGVLEITLPPPEALTTKKAHKQLASAILAIFEIALRERNPDKRRAVFSDLLLELLAKW
jgi:hypothetical protein